MTCLQSSNGVVADASVNQLVPVENLEHQATPVLT